MCIFWLVGKDIDLIVRYNIKYYVIFGWIWIYYIINGIKKVFFVLI